jgi:formylglycine-generating enzyme required for sulfatase activity
VIRGGSWYDSAFGCRSANRNYLSPGNTANNGYYYGYYYFHGFRCALPAGQ